MDSWAGPFPAQHVNQNMLRKLTESLGRTAIKILTLYTLLGEIDWGNCLYDFVRDFPVWCFRYIFYKPFYEIILLEKKEKKKNPYLITLKCGPPKSRISLAAW